MDFNKLPSIKDCVNLNGKKVLVRMSLNVPIEGNKISDDSRIVAGLPTIEYLRDRGAKVIIISHIGREKTESLSLIAKYLEKYFPVRFIENIMTETATVAVDEMKEGEVILFENLRKYDGEVNNDMQFAQHLAHMAEIYVNDDFPVAHRKHASIAGIVNFLPSYFGFRFIDEVKNLSTAFDPEHPFLLILGGAKVETKSPLLQKFNDKADKIFVGGVLANDFFKAKGSEIGKSVTSSTPVPANLLNATNLLLPRDVTVLREERRRTISLDQVQKEDFIYDIGPNSVDDLINIASQSAFVLWNGPLGYCEKDFCGGTIRLAEALVNSKSRVILGGGDTIAAVPKELLSKVSFVSTGGGAMLDFLANGSLPAIEAIFLHQR